MGGDPECWGDLTVRPIWPGDAWGSQGRTGKAYALRGTSGTLSWPIPASEKWDDEKWMREKAALYQLKLHVPKFIL